MTTDKEETVKGNKLIAEFMGGVITKRDTSLPYPEGLPKWAKHEYDFDTLKIGGYEYHSSWDWLMPVVEKIGNMYIKYASLPEMREIHGCSMFAPISMIYEQVISFIKWHNTQSNKDNDAGKQNQ
jgi:hypothetical protein